MYVHRKGIACSNVIFVCNLFRLNEPITVGVTSSSPVYYAFHFTPDVERVLIKVQSSKDTEDICAIASMQIASVSVYYCMRIRMYVYVTVFGNL